MLPQPIGIPIASSQGQYELIYRAYSALTTTQPLDAEAGLGGQLLYAGEMVGSGRELLFAANIAGAASLAASADAAVQRQAIRDGVIDFLVTSLEEALRVLKNEIRKREAVSVGVATDPRQLVEAMLHRGVLPDLLPSTPSSGIAAESSGLSDLQMKNFLGQGARTIRQSAALTGGFTTWSVDRELARWLPKLDACVQTVIPAGDLSRHRWLRLAPRYLGRLAHRQHGVFLSPAETAEFRQKAEDLMRTVESSVPVFTVDIQATEQQ